MQRKHDTSRSDLDMVGDCSNGSTGHRRIRIETTEGMEVALWCPNSGKVVCIGKFGPFKQQPVLVPRPLSRVVGKVEQTELQVF